MNVVLPGRRDSSTGNYFSSDVTVTNFWTSTIVDNRPQTVSIFKQEDFGFEEPGGSGGSSFYNYNTGNSFPRDGMSIRCIKDE